MRTIVIDPPKAETKIGNKPDLKWVERIARLMDSKFIIPGTKIRFGLDPILSLIPGFGDLAGYAVSSVLIYTMYKNGASQKLVLKMTLNATLDTIFGAIPIVGTFFDLFYKANDRNVRLLKEHYIEGKHQGSGKGLLVLTAIILLVLLVAIIYVTWKVLKALYQLIF